MHAAMPQLVHSRSTRGPDMNKQMPDLMAAGQPAQAETSQLSVVGSTSPHVLCPI